MSHRFGEPIHSSGHGREILRCPRPRLHRLGTEVSASARSVGWGKNECVPGRGCFLLFFFCIYGMHFLYGGFILHFAFAFCCIYFHFTRGFDSIVWLCVIACNLCLVDVLCILDLSFVLFFSLFWAWCIDIFKSLGYPVDPHPHPHPCLSANNPCPNLLSVDERNPPQSTQTTIRIITANAYIPWFWWVTKNYLTVATRQKKLHVFPPSEGNSICQRMEEIVRSDIMETKQPKLHTFYAVTCINHKANQLAGWHLPISTI